jgi:hypothetical protein
MTPHELIELASRLTDKLFDIKGEMRALYVVETDESLNLMPPPPHLDMDAGLRLIKSMMKEIGATAYVYVNEAWTVDGSKGDLKVRASEHPNRKEQVVFIAETSDKTLLGHRDIIRADGRKPTLGPLIIETKFDGHSGRMVGLLRAEETLH